MLFCLETSVPEVFKNKLFIKCTIQYFRGEYLVIDLMTSLLICIILFILEFYEIDSEFLQIVKLVKYIM